MRKSRDPTLLEWCIIAICTAAMLYAALFGNWRGIRPRPREKSPWEVKAKWLDGK